MPRRTRRFTAENSLAKTPALKATMCVRELVKSTTSATSTSTDAYFIPMTDWVSSTGLDGMRFAMTTRNRTNDPAVKPGYQAVAVRVSDPSAPVVITDGSYSTSNGTTTYDESPPAALASTLFIRFGPRCGPSSWSAARSEAGNRGRARDTIRLEA